jgi:hypothetical protein
LSATTAGDAVIEDPNYDPATAPVGSTPTPTPEPVKVTKVEEEPVVVNKLTIQDDDV